MRRGATLVSTSEKGSGQKDEFSSCLLAFAGGERRPPIIKSETAGNRNGKPAFYSEVRKLLQNVCFPPLMAAELLPS